MLATQRRPQKAANQQFPTTPAPFMGIDTVDAYTNMPIQYCISAVNCIAAPSGGITNRMGYEQFTTGFTDPITSFLPYNARNSATSKLFCVSGGDIYDTTSSGAIGAAVVSGLSTDNVYWQSAQAVNTTTTYMIAVNGANWPQMYDGSWITCSQVSSPSSPGQFSDNDQNGNAVNMEAFSDVILHAQRWWFVDSGSTIAYYTDIGEVGGQLYAFDFGTLFPRGGCLQKLGSWTIDTGYGVVYNLVAISNIGDVVIFQGNDPSQAVTFALIGQYQLGAPVGLRCIVPLVGDLGYLSTDGLFPLSAYIQSPRVDISSALTYRITPTIQDNIQLYGDTLGWEMVIYPAQKLMLLNVPQGSQTQNTQFVFNMNKNIQGWTQFTNWPSQCFCLFEEELYFGGPTFVGLAFQNYVDGAASDGSGGSPITASVLQAFSNLEVPGYKDVHQIRPFFTSGQSNPSVSVGINTDFNISAPTGSSSYTPPTGALWGTATWGTATWGSTASNPNAWITTLCWPGEYVAPTVSWTASTATSWIGTDWNVTSGNRFG